MSKFLSSTASLFPACSSSSKPSAASPSSSKSSPAYRSLARTLFTSAFAGLGAPSSSEVDLSSAQSRHIRLTFGEVSFEGVEKMMDSKHLDANKARTVFDLGAGNSRLIVQVFLEFPHLERCVGVEFSSARFLIGIQAMKNLARALKSRGLGNVKLVESENSISLTILRGRNTNDVKERENEKENEFEDFSHWIAEFPPARTIEIRRGDLFDCPDYHEAEIIVCETNIDHRRFDEFRSFMSKAKSGMRLLLYNDLESLLKPEFSRLPDNGTSDLFPSSWGNPRFHLLQKK